MIEGQVEQPNIYRTIADRLSESGIKRIAIIDDAFDTPSRSNIEVEGVLDVFFAEVDGDAEARNEIDSLGLSLNNVNDITDEFIRVIYSLREK